MRLFTAMSTLLDAYKAELSAAGELDKLCYVTMFPGAEVPYDFGPESCGAAAWVRLATANPTATFPQPVTSPDNCAYTLAFPVEMGIYRTAPSGDDTNDSYQPPTSEEFIEAARIQYDDLEIMHRAIVAARQKIDLMVIGSYIPFGPGGGVYGGIWNLTIGSDDE